MKRNLYESVIAIPYNFGDGVERPGALSAVLGLYVSAADPNAVATITVTHSEVESGPYEAVKDERLFLDKTEVKRDDKGHIIQSYLETPVEAGDVVNIDIDLVGCARYVKINAAYTAGGAAASVTASSVLVLGDFTQSPPEL